MPICKKCNEFFSRTFVIEGKKYYLQRRIYCIKCSPFRMHNTKKLEEDKLVNGEFHCDCIVCGRHYTFKRTSGNSKSICNSCRTAIRRYKIKKELVEYKGGKCEKCGYNKNIKNLEFHHLTPTDKKFNISNEMGKLSLNDYKKEVDKCLMLCTLCHRDVHDELDGLTKKLENYILRATSSSG